MFGISVPPPPCSKTVSEQKLSPFQGRYQTQISWILPISFLPWYSVLSSSETLIHTFSLIESNITLPENFRKKRQIVSQLSMAMSEKPIIGRNKSSHPGVSNLDMNTVTVLGDPYPLPTTECCLCNAPQKRNPRIPSDPKQHPSFWHIFKSLHSWWSTG